MPVPQGCLEVGRTARDFMSLQGHGGYNKDPSASQVEEANTRRRSRVLDQPE